MPENKQESSAENDQESPDEMSADELAAFNKIMGEIENGDDSSPTDAAKEDAEKDPVPESEDDFSAELERVAQEADASGEEPAAESDTDDLDEDQQKAFESIMAQIAVGDADETGSPSDGGGQEPTRESEDDFSAELEKVAQEADTPGDEPAAEPAAESNTDELDEDQQKAFESIMAQIGGGDDAAGDEDPGKDADEDGAQADEDDFAAELEKVVQEADADTIEASNPGVDEDDQAAESEAPEINNAEESDDSLDKDQQEAFESIMAQIEGGKSEPESPDVAQASSEVRPPETQGKEAEATDSGSVDGDTDGEAEDISTDIDDILNAVTVEEEPPESPDSDAIEIASEQEQEDRKAADLKDNPDLQVQDEGAAPETATDDQPTQPASEGKKKAQETLPAESEAGGRNDRRASSTGKILQAATPLRETGQNAEKKWKKIAIGASAVALLTLALVGYAYWSGRVVGEAQPIPTARQNEDQTTAALTPEAGHSQTQEPTEATKDLADQSRLKAVAASLDNLRGELMAKQDEIEELRAYYKAGIDAETLDIVRTVGNRNDGKLTPATAMADPRIRLGLTAIQRRDTYIRKLAAPTETLKWNSEELLYLFRKAKLLELMTTKTSDIDVDGFIGQAEEIIDAHARALTELNIDDVAVSALPMETLWMNIAKQLSGKTGETEPVIPATDNAAISESICQGNFSQKHKLTEITAETARCLARWKGKDLFLNEVKQLHPEAARQLAAWGGEWLGLNGLEELSPEAATHLSRWSGKGLSLNGLTRLSPRVVAILSEWQGDQIELVNVKHMAHWENPNTRLFLSEELVRKRKSARN